VQALIARIERERGRLDIVVNDICMARRRRRSFGYTTARRLL
jgi:hypothetical protein